MLSKSVKNNDGDSLQGEDAGADRVNDSSAIANGNRFLFILYLIVTAVVCGAQVMIVEVMGSRIIGPFFGVSLFVWTSLITVTLVALAAGYAFGGSLSDKRGNPGYLYGIILLSGILVLVIPYLKNTVIMSSQPLGLRLGSFVSAAVLFGPSLFLLGCVSPYIVKLAAREMRNIGRTVGMFYAVSTMGSVIGTILAGFVLIAYFSVSDIFRFAGGTLIALSAVYFLAFRRKWHVLVFLALPFLPADSDSLMKKTLPKGTIVNEVYERDSFYGKIKVVDYYFNIFKTRELIIDGLVQGKVDKVTGTSVHEYSYMMNYIPLNLNPDGGSCLVIGLGAGILPMLYENAGITTDVVEIDPVIENVARKYFSFRPSGKVHISDARYFLHKSDKKYDYMLLDVYNGDTTPGHVLSLEAFGLMREALTGRGILAINLIGNLQDDTFITASVIRTLEEVFETVEIYLTGSNLVVIAYDYPAVALDTDNADKYYVHVMIRKTFQRYLGRKFRFPPDTRAIVLTDDYNPMEFFDVRLKEGMRKDIIDNTDFEILL
jgi:spermidine synthase